MEKIREIAKIVTELKMNRVETLFSTHYHLADNQFTKVANAFADDQIKTEDEVSAMIGAKKRLR